MRSKKIEDYKESLKLNDEQKEILIGLMLGDGHLESKNSGRTYRLKIEQSLKHQQYVEYLYGYWRDWVLTPPKVKKTLINGRVHQKLNFQTLSHSSFRFFAAQFYRGKVKVVPKLIHRWLSPKALAIWFMDDGSVKSRESKALILNTQSFAIEDIKILCQALERRYGLQCKPRKQAEGFQIFISGKSYELFKSIILPHMCGSMLYKIPIARKTRMPKE